MTPRHRHRSVQRSRFLSGARHREREQPQQRLQEDGNLHRRDAASVGRAKARQGFHRQACSTFAHGVQLHMPQTVKLLAATPPMRPWLLAART